MDTQTESVRSITSFIAIGALAALAGCGELGDVTRPLDGEGQAARPDGAFVGTDVATAAAYRDMFARYGLALDAIRFGAPVPRLFASRLPEDMASLDDLDLRQQVFVSTLLPIILDVNAAIRLERARILSIVEQVAAGEPVHDFDRRWIDRIALRYGTDDLRDLLRRVDEIPPSLAIAQAAIESGWGTSRFAQNGNALYGQRITHGDAGLRPAGYDGDPGFRVASFPDLMASVESYALNLNTHDAYEKFRLRRARLREGLESDQGTLDGHALVAALHNYAGRGWDYVVIARSVIRDNRLSALDSARLRPITTPRRPVVAVAGPTAP